MSRHGRLERPGRSMGRGRLLDWGKRVADRCIEVGRLASNGNLPNGKMKWIKGNSNNADG